MTDVADKPETGFEDLAATLDVGIRRGIRLHGVVQGVGFRPHVARLAAGLDLAGTCRNDDSSVLIEVEGPPGRVAEFERRVVAEGPPLARVTAVHTEDLVRRGDRGFRIGRSERSNGSRVLVPPDTAVCADCLGELTSPSDRRFRHPFITCTNCGPRFTIITDVPYDRPATTMSRFTMCPACAAEYADPVDRRFHAQPISCHDCGPALSVTDRAGEVLATGTEASLAITTQALRDGAIVAVKGIGGYHLVCDAASTAALALLRERKHRPDQPFAVMVADLRAAGTIVEVGDAAGVLCSAERPIVLLPQRSGAPVADAVAPGLDVLGVMLPYAPVHHLLFARAPDASPGAPPVLVMTSGNLSGEPLCFEDQDALLRLGPIVDLFLTHDRPIAVPCEDSVLAWDEGEEIPVRRSRGYAPLPVSLPGLSSVSLPLAGERTVVATGADVKNTVALAHGTMAFVSAHIGDLESLESRAAQEQAVDQLVRFHRRTPDLVVTDLHPGYAARARGQQIAARFGVPVLEVQHHHAHLAALAAEHRRLADPVLGIVFDGTGYGCDGGVWGGEFLLLGDDARSATRLGRLGTVAVPGGDAGVRNPVRTAALALLRAGIDPATTPLGTALTDAERAFLPRLADGHDGWVATSSVGRLFDVVAALLGIRGRVTYEAQAAIELECRARRWHQAGGRSGPTLVIPLVPGDPAVLDPDPLVRDLAAAVSDGADAGALAWAFHQALATATAELAGSLAAASGTTVIGLTGGVFANRILLSDVRRRLLAAGFEVLTHRLVPCNDGGLALGQVAVGLQALAAGTDR